MEANTTEQPITEISMELDKKSYRQVLRFAVFFRKRNLVAALLLYAIFPPLLLFLCYRTFFQWDWRGEDWPSVVVFAFVCIIWGAYLISFETKRRRPIRQLIKAKPLPQTYAFYEEQILVTDGVQHMQAVNTIQYTLFNKVYETKHAFYMIFHKENTYVLDKRFFNEAEANALRNLFARKFGDNFKQYKQK